MKKLGFTLAEVLITLGIIGVVAALTTPALVLSSRNEASAAKLAVCISNLENAFQNAITQEGVDDLFQTRMWTNINGGAGIGGNGAYATRLAFVGELGRYLKLSGTIDGGNNPITSFYGGGFYPMTTTGGTSATATDFNGRTGENTSGVPIILKNGAVMFIRTGPKGAELTEAQIQARISKGSNYLYNAADLLIDVNGKSAPNTYGRDIFAFQVGETGTLYPYGGLDVSVFEYDDTAHTWSDANTSYNCTSGDFGKSTASNAGIGCAGRIIAEGYKMNY